MTTLPYSREGEWALIGVMLTQAKAVPEIVGQQLEGDDFYLPDTRLVFDAACEAYYADDPVDPVTIGEKLREPLAQHWSCEPTEVASKLYSAVAGQSYQENAVSYAELVRTFGDKRRLLMLIEAAKDRLNGSEHTPSEVGDFLSSEAVRIAMSRKKRSEIMDWMDVGKEYVQHLQRQKEARERGQEIGVYSGFSFVDHYLRGLGPTELWMCGGEPGVGKSAVCWTVGEGFARRQAQHPKDTQVHTLICSMEMGLIPSGARYATQQSGIDGVKLREGDISTAELQRVWSDWAAKQALPLHFNFASNFKLSQLRAMVVDAINRYNVGFVILDHFRTVDPDRRVNNSNQEDELKARFLKEEICKDLDVAMLCLAHTVKMPSRREGGDGRPTLAHLRGSYQVAAYCDAVSFVYRPSMYADQDDVLSGAVDETQAEMIWEKNRNGARGSQTFTFDAPKMIVSD